MDVIDRMLPLVHRLLVPGGLVGIEHDDTTSDTVQPTVRPTVVRGHRGPARPDRSGPLVTASG